MQLNIFFLLFLLFYTFIRLFWGCAQADAVSNGKGPIGAVSVVAVSLNVQRSRTFHLAAHLHLKSILYVS